MEEGWWWGGHGFRKAPRLVLRDAAEEVVRRGCTYSNGKVQRQRYAAEVGGCKWYPLLRNQMPYCSARLAKCLEEVTTLAELGCSYARQWWPARPRSAMRRHDCSAQSDVRDGGACQRIKKVGGCLPYTSGPIMTAHEPKNSADAIDHLTSC